MNSRVIEPIIITPEQIMAAAAKIAAQDGGAWEYTSEQYLMAVRSFLESSISDIVADADWHASTVFSADKKYVPSFCDKASDFAVPEPPEWAHDEVNLATDIVQRRQLQPDENGDIIYA